MELEIHFDKKDWAGVTDCFIVRRDAQGKRFIAKPMQLEFVPLEEHQKVEPSLSFGPIHRAVNFFEELVRALARAGYKQESNDAGELKATKLHLADMQRMVFTERKQSDG